MERYTGKELSMDKKLKDVIAEMLENDNDERIKNLEDFSGFSYVS